jgi:NADP-dependent 3-hydroxy acid dehydrogenase YdfG
MNRPLEQKLAWITGAGSGIGRAVAVALAQAGAAVALTGRRVEALEETAALVRDAGGTAFLAPADVSDARAVTLAHAMIVDALGEPHILVNNAGWNERDRHWRELQPDAAERLVSINLTAGVLCTLAALPAMRRRRDGFLVHVASVSATGIFLPSGPIYTAAKFGLRAMSATLNAEEGIHGIRSICINPGEVATPILDKRPVPITPEQRAILVQPQDVAAAVLFCVTQPARVCISELTITPTDNAFYRHDAHAIANRT